MPEFEAVIGIETHIQLNTDSKIFCACSTDSWRAPPNTHICPICTGLPGVLPSLNQQVVEKALILATAMNAEKIDQASFFARKNYFYPDLPKGYQISQYDEPLAVNGSFELPLPEGNSRRISIIKLHIEEDAGKTVYKNGKRLIDFNRCGVPLVEMVTGPDFRSADEVAQYLIRLRQLLRWLEISDADMERGQLRCDANVSIRNVGEHRLNTKTEIKNVNSITNVRDAVKSEIERQMREVGAGGVIEAWTLDWDDERGVLSKMRSKETEADYRYFREPDLLPIEISPGAVAATASQLPELPLARRSRFVEAYDIPEYDAEILTEERSLSDFFEATVAAHGGDPKRVSNWVMNDVLRLIREHDTSAGELGLQPGELAEIIGMVEAGTISSGVGKDLLVQVRDSNRTPAQIVEEEGLAQVSDASELSAVAAQILEANPDQVAAYEGGKMGLIGWFVGQMMQETGGQADPKAAKELLEEMLGS
ncbi:MAG: Asp-tRNA(Asn)/Glu-tRNA(Gln) amidotransferase subunit GatB [Anaerolineae bacterium]|nr:MAG: Asp-tRNA(Asn)/Glu-tRNA(Gln) amidotransferase subunit GatB [Anaerolineae bacterium]